MYLGMDRRNEELMLLPKVARGFHITDIERFFFKVVGHCVPRVCKRRFKPV